MASAVSAKKGLRKMSPLVSSQRQYVAAGYCLFLKAWGWMQASDQLYIRVAADA
jgi:hypothetical protein